MPEFNGTAGLKQLFGRYYRNFRSVEPDQISKREIGYIPFDGTMVRHMGFRTHQEIEKFAYEKVPRHLYYSSTYYKFPLEKKMNDKGWQGAELIFDLDADHLKGAPSMTYEQILLEVRKHTYRLVQDFLMGMAGFGEDELKLYFSGGRGYHVHVVSEKVYSLSSDARREISNLVRGEGLTIKDALPILESSARFTGWLKWIDDAVVSIYEGISKGIFPAFMGEKEISAMQSALETEINFLGTRAKRIQVFLRPGREKYGFLNQYDTHVVSSIIDEVREERACEIDEPVTTDVHRLIRYPFSLHGKTGMIVKPVPLSQLNSYDPLSDAIPDSSDVPVRIKVNKNFSIRMKGELFSLREGEHNVPGYVACIAAGMGGAQIISIIN